jgi:hypothetical protein
MNLSNFVSLHPYFKVHPGKFETFKAGFPASVEKTATEKERNSETAPTTNPGVGCIHRKIA